MLKLKNIHKHYGDIRVLSGLDMNVEAGDVYGFLGRNGAGKSTALQIIMGITLASQGDISLFDQTVNADDPSLRRLIGYVAQEQHFYEWMTAAEIGKFQSGFYPSWDHPEYKRLLKRLEVPEHRKILGFSGGMRTKLALCLALAHRPELLLLDEPTAGMDAIARREFIDIVRDQAASGERTTLFSSHLIDEIEMASDKIGILHKGKLNYEGSLKTLKSTVRRFQLTNTPLDTCQSQSEPHAEPLSDLLAPQTSSLLEDRLNQGTRSITIKYPGWERSNNRRATWAWSRPM